MKQQVDIKLVVTIVTCAFFLGKWTHDPVKNQLENRDREHIEKIKELEQSNEKKDKIIDKLTAKEKVDALSFD